jgi:photosystem II stability/assembly factor-like uncharacterized protein
MLSPLQEFRGMRGVGSDVYFAGDEGSVLRLADASGTWTDVSVPAGTTGATISSFPSFLSVGGSATDDVWLAGLTSPRSGALVHSADRGQSWQRVDVGTSSVLLGVWSVDRDHVLVTTGDGQILVTTDHGAQWTTAFSDSRMAIWAAWGSGSGDLYAVGGVSVVEGSDGGAAAGDIDAGAPAPDGGPPDGGGVPDAGGAGSTTAFVGVVLHSADGGASWRVVADASTACGLWHVAGTADGAIVYAVGACGSVVWTTDHGASWSKSGAAGAGEDYGISDVWVSPSGTSYLLAAGSAYTNLAAPTIQLVCRSIDVEDLSPLGPMLTMTTGCENLPPFGSPTNNYSSTPVAVWGTSDDDVWILGAGLVFWHRS